MKNKIFFSTVVLVLMLSFSVFGFSQWITFSDENEMDGTKTWYTMSPSVGPTKSMSFPYEDMTAMLAVGYDGDKAWVYIAFDSSPNIQNDTTMDGYNRIDTRIKWDESIENTTLFQEWGSRFLHFKDTGTVVSKIKQSNTVLLELDWYGEDEVYFLFPLDGAKEALAEIFNAL